MNIDEVNEMNERIFMNMNDMNDINDMNIFETLFNSGLNNLTRDNFIFNSHFIPNKLKNKYTWKKYIKYKYYILKNFLLVNNNNIICISNTKILDFFSQIQRKMMALYKFKQICLFKTTKYLNEQID